MIKETLNSFHYKNISSLDFGLAIYEKNVYSAPERDITETEVPGRNGNLITDNKRFKNINIKYSCYIMPETRFNDLAEQSRKIKAWLLAESGYFKLFDTYNKNYFRLAAYSSALDISEFITQIGKAPITFNCKPFLYSLEGQKTITITDETSINNYEAFSSKPYVKITGSGDISLSINNDTFNFDDVDGYIEIDSEIMNAYKATTPQNSKMTADKFPELYPGNNNISWTGSVTSVSIIPRWCTL